MIFQYFHRNLHFKFVPENTCLFDKMSSHKSEPMPLMAPFMTHESCSDCTGYITHLPHVRQESNHAYFSIQLKLSLHEYNTIGVVLNKSSEVTTNIFKASKLNLVKVILKKVSTAINSTKFYYSYRGSLMEDGPCRITFIIDENPSVDRKKQRTKLIYDWLHQMDDWK